MSLTPAPCITSVLIPEINNLGNIHVLRKHKGGREGVSQMLTFAYVGGGGVKSHAYVIIFFEKFALPALSVFHLQ